MNGTLAFVLLLVTVVMCANVITTYLKQKNKQGDPKELDDTLAKIDQLEDRIRVLERIITENRFDLKNEIDSL